MKRTVKLILILVFLLCFVSCDRNDIEVNDLQTQAYITKSGRMGFSFYANGVFSSDSGNRVKITSPDGNFTWYGNMSPVEFEKVKYYGSGDFSMPEGIPLPTGTYNYTIICKDGRTIEHSFSVYYTDKDGALERCTDVPYYDSVSNLTVVR